MRWSYVPPLMVYFAAGVSGFTGIIEAFFVKEKLGLSAALLASLGFWAGLPWAMKMPLGHLVDRFWHRKALFVYLGAALMAASQLGTKYLNRLFVVERGHYDELGLLMIVTMAIGLVLPVLAVLTLQPRANERWRNLGARLTLLKAYFTN